LAESFALSILQERIRVCTLCADAGFIPAARPLTMGPPDANFLVIGQAPSRSDGLNGTFYEGPAGKRLQSWFAEAGFAPGDFGNRIYLAAITKCFPGRLPGSSKDRVPSRAEQALCRPWLDGEIALLNPPVIVLFGALAISTFLRRAPLIDLVGRVFERDGRLYVPLPHSSGASTWLNAPENRALLAEAIARLRELRIRFRNG
jgi:uracil-DNA glycosylase family 4